MSKVSRFVEVDDLSILQRLATAQRQIANDGGSSSNSTFSFWEKTSWYPQVARRLFHPLLLDPRNDCFVLFTVLMLFTVLPSAVWLMLDFAWWRAALHVALVIQNAGSYTSVLHNSCHKKVYSVSWMNYIVPVLLGPLFGQTWNTYYYHHIKHHHIEDNGPNDLSSTLRFRRDSIAHFAIYFLRFLLLVIIELPVYFVRRGRYWNAAASFSGEVASLAFVWGLAKFNTLGALFVLFVPLIIIRFGMMSGNWAQHAFIDQANPTSNFKSSVTCIHHSYNRVAFNDGYHTSHHLHARRHWSEHPTHLVREVSVYYASRPVILQDIDFMGLWVLLMLQRYNRLAQLYVHLGPESERPSQQEIIDMLKSRTRAFSDEQIRHHYPYEKARTSAVCYF